MPDNAVSLPGGASVMPDSGIALPNTGDVMPDSAIVEHDNGDVEHDGGNVEHYGGGVLLYTGNVVTDCAIVGRKGAIVEYYINTSAINYCKNMKTFFNYNIHISHLSTFFTHQHLTM